MTAPTDRHGLEVIGMDEALELLGSVAFGRLAYMDAGVPVIVPVNHGVDGATLVLRSLDGGKLGAAIFEKAVAFEADELDPATRTGWSVVVRGRAEVLDGDVPPEVAERVDSWAVADGAAATWIRIVPDEIGGRRLG
jgi:nitroimidazol reductase NimA-like FMN-containing flavoprotein (pyridoxamine 5'-phosphate oxidase superfamily)